MFSYYSLLKGADMGEISLIKLMKVLDKYKKMISIVVFGAMLATLIISFFLPKSYLSTATVIAPEVAAGGNIFGGTFGLLADELGAAQITSQAVQTLLKSERMQEDIIKKFDLINLYRVESMYYAKRILKERIKVSIKQDDGIIEVKVIANSPQLSADIANYFIFNLSNLNKELKITSAAEIVKILDPATPPIKKYKPKKMINTLIAGVLSFIFSLSIIIYKEYIEISV
jgi:tyrosine-protein kinase Etk/Wzc